MVYVCDSCGALFSRTGKLDQCPDCGKTTVRFANSVERRKFASHVAELICEECSEGTRFPNYVETEISTINGFTFKLPVTALQIDSSMVVDILVEYGQNSADRNELLANVWAKQSGGVTARFLMPVRLPAKRDEPPKEQVNRVFAALSDNDTFKTRLYDFAMEQLVQGGGV